MFRVSCRVFESRYLRSKRRERERERDKEQFVLVSLTN